MSNSGDLVGYEAFIEMIVGRMNARAAKRLAVERPMLRCLFTRCSELVQRVQAARRGLRLPQELARLDRFDLLILDNLSDGGQDS